MFAVSSNNSNPRHIEGERKQSQQNNPPASQAVQKCDTYGYEGEIYLASLVVLATVVLGGAYVVDKYALPLANRITQYEANMSKDAMDAIAFGVVTAVWTGIMWAGGAFNRRQ